ncbi:hypothetical protein, partial [Escherichia coli]|uniref:hypothetical protein n=1 Tax=Escherichia coli TaxID=562 RepID=UPI00102D6DE8
EKRVFLVILFTSFSGSLVSRISGAVHIVLLDFLFLDIAVSTGLNTAMKTVVKRVNSRSDWQDANQ